MPTTSLTRLDMEIEQLKWELARARHELDEAQAECRLLREALKETAADLAHHIQTSSGVPALPRLPSVAGGQG